MIVAESLKVQLFSDLHQEFSAFTPPDADVDVVVLAGDIYTGTRGIEWAITTFKNKPVVFLAGNHEFYGHSFPSLNLKLQAKAAGTHVHVLQNSTVEINGWLLLGATLWTNYALNGNSVLSMMAASGSMNDYSRIRHSDHDYRRLRPADILPHHAESVQWLDTTLEANSHKRCVVITHHAPSGLSIPEKYRDDPNNPCYASSLEHLILKHQPVAWLHGHIHAFRDYWIDNTRVLCHPRGYDDGKAHKEQTGFDAHRVFELANRSI